MDGEEIGREIEALDQGQFMGDGGGDLVRRTIRIAPFQPLCGQPAQGLGRAFMIADHFAGILIDQFLEAEIDAAGEGDGIGDGRLIAAKQARHFLRRFEMVFGIGGDEIAGLFDPHMLADTGDDIGQRLAFRDMIERVIRGDAVQPEPGGAPGQPVQAFAIAAIETAAQGEVMAGLRAGAEVRCPGLPIRIQGIGRQQDEDLVL